MFGVLQEFGVVTLPCPYKGKTSYIMYQVLDRKKNIDLLGRDDSVQLGDAIAIGYLPGEYDIKINKHMCYVLLMHLKSFLIFWNLNFVLLYF